jgi:hypothetical protein
MHRSCCCSYEPNHPSYVKILIFIIFFTMLPINHIFFYITAYILCCYFHIIPNLQHWSIATYDLYFYLHPAYILRSKSIVPARAFLKFWVYIMARVVNAELGSVGCSAVPLLLHHMMQLFTFYNPRYLLFTTLLHHII